MDTDQFREILDSSLERERLFREDFSQLLMAEMRNYVDQKFEHWFRTRLPLVLPEQGGRIFTHTADNHRIMLSLSEPFITFHVLEHGMWEAPLRRVLQRLLKPGDCYVDVGANIGLHVLYATTLVGQDGVILALEPHPITAQLLRDNLELNGLEKVVHVIEAAACEEHGNSRSFEYFPQHSAMSGFRLTKDRVERFRGTPVLSTVPTVTIDALCAERGCAPDVIKIDIEGFEPIALAGAQGCLSGEKKPAFLLEFDSIVMSEVLGSSAANESFSRFITTGYHAFRVSEDDLIRVPDIHSACEHNDILFVHPHNEQYARALAATD